MPKTKRKQSFDDFAKVLSLLLRPLSKEGDRAIKALTGIEKRSVECRNSE